MFWRDIVCGGGEKELNPFFLYGRVPDHLLGGGSRGIPSQPLCVRSGWNRGRGEWLVSRETRRPSPTHAEKKFVTPSLSPSFPGTGDSRADWRRWGRISHRERRIGKFAIGHQVGRTLRYGRIPHRPARARLKRPPPAPAREKGKHCVWPRLNRNGLSQILTPSHGFMLDIQQGKGGG